MGALAADEAAQLLVLAHTLQRLEQMRPLPQGLFRVAAPQEEAQALAATLLAGDAAAVGAELHDCLDPYVCADALKKWLRERPLMPAGGEPDDARSRMEQAAAAAPPHGVNARAQTADGAQAARDELAAALAELPAMVQAVMEALLPFLRSVVGPDTSMTAGTLAICLAPSLFDGGRLQSPRAAELSHEEQLQTNAAEVKILQVLLEEPELDELAVDDDTPLILSEVVRGGPERLRNLLHAGRIGDVNGALEDKWTLLHWSARLGAQHCASLLLAHGADVSIGDWSSYTALHVAATVEVADVLLMGRNACVALQMRNNQGKTALEEHTEEGRAGVAMVLRRARQRMVVARQQRLAWAAAGMHRRLATRDTGTAPPGSSSSSSSSSPVSPVFEWLSDDLVCEVGKLIPPICRASEEDLQAAKAADGRWRGEGAREPPLPTELRRGGGPHGAVREKCVVQ